MFEAAELGNRVSKADYKSRVPAIRAELLRLQLELRERGLFPVIIVFAGVDGAGKSETVHVLNEWMDPRWLITRAYGEPSDEERDRPEYWRYWRTLPPRARIGLFLSSWYSSPILDRVYRRIDADEFDAQMHRIARFEQALADGGALILKFWMHLGREAQRKRLKKLEADPLTAWRVQKRQWTHWRSYKRFTAAAERCMQRTGLSHAPWMIVDGQDERYRTLQVATTIRDAIAAHLARSRKTHRTVPGKPAPTPRRLQILAGLDMTKTLPRGRFDERLEEYQGRLHLLHRRAHNRGLSSVVVFEGWDAAGKGGAIRRVTAALDPRISQVIPIAAPTDEERAHHYLWRFWRHLPRAGVLTIFDRSWYGRVLVERVEAFASRDEWMRAYGEINDFEEQLVDHGIVVAKFWLHITPGEQLRRFKERQRLDYKRWKLTDEDWRNRAKWRAYALAANEMIERTSTRTAAWTLVEADDKRYARIKVLETLCARLEAALD
jgi:polyphosphate:AMP phosphotransferase